MEENSQQAEDRASTTGGGSPRPDTFFNRASVFRFNKYILVETANLINSRRSIPAPTHANTITPREVLLAILWRAYVRARWPNGGADGVKTSISFQANVRGDIIPPLDDYWMGNVEITATANEDLLHLGMYYDLSMIERTANIIHNLAKSAGSDVLVRSRIAIMNASEELGDHPGAQLIVHDWSTVPEMPDQQMDLALGLGRPDAIRRTGRSFGRNEMVLLLEDAHAQAWDVQVELHRDWLSAMSGDSSLRKFLWQ